MKVLIIGKNIKNVYLSLDAKNFELDKNQNAHLDLVYDGGEKYYNDRFSIMTGQKLADEVISNFRIETETAFSPENPETCDDFQYILLSKNNYINLAPEFIKQCDFNGKILEKRTAKFDYIYIDWSAELNNVQIKAILDYLETHPKTRLAWCFDRSELPKLLNAPDLSKTNLTTFYRLLQRAEIVFVMGKKSQMMRVKQILGTLSTLKLIYVTENQILAGVFKEDFQNKDLKVTRDVAATIIAGTIFSALITDWNLQRALMLSKINVENSKANKTLKINQLSDKLREALAIR